jgi:hypothetical protein
MGLAVAGLAFFAGRCFLGARGPRRVADPSSEGDNPAELVVVPKKRDRRAGPRRGGNAITIDVADPADPDAPPFTAWVLDRSPGGLCLEFDRAVKAGTVVNVRPQKAPQPVPWVAIQVRSCAQEGTVYKLGCQFVQTPTWNVMMLFG